MGNIPIITLLMGFCFAVVHGGGATIIATFYSFAKSGMSFIQNKWISL